MSWKFTDELSVRYLRNHKWTRWIRPKTCPLISQGFFQVTTATILFFGKIHSKQAFFNYILNKALMLNIHFFSKWIFLRGKKPVRKKSAFKMMNHITFRFLHKYIVCVSNIIIINVIFGINHLFRCPLYYKLFLAALVYMYM